MSRTISIRMKNRIQTPTLAARMIAEAEALVLCKGWRTRQPFLFQAAGLNGYGGIEVCRSHLGSDASAGHGDSQCNARLFLGWWQCLRSATSLGRTGAAESGHPGGGRRNTDR